MNLMKVRNEVSECKGGINKSELNLYDFNFSVVLGCVPPRSISESHNALEFNTQTKYNYMYYSRPSLSIVVLI